MADKKEKKTDYYFGEVIAKFYDDLRCGSVRDISYMPRSDLAYITSLLNEKFGKKYSFQQVKELLNDCLGAAI